MCRPAWSRALTESQRLQGLAALRRVRDRTDREHAESLDVDALESATPSPTAGTRPGTGVLVSGSGSGRPA
jgi:hypothetical protein